jgi:hypothetical protein
MAYAAYREHPGVERSTPRLATSCASPPLEGEARPPWGGPAAADRSHAPMSNNTSPFYVLDVTVCCADALRVRRSIAACPDAGVVRCEPLLHGCCSQESDAPCVRLMIRLPLARYADVLHRLIECVPSGEIGRLVSWRDHLARCGLRHGH